MCGPKTTVLVGNEERDASLQKHFVEELGRHFTIKPVKRRKLEGLDGFHDLVQLWICKLRRPKKGGGEEEDGGQQEQQEQGKQGEGEQEEQN